MKKRLLEILTGVAVAAVLVAIIGAGGVFGAQRGQHPASSGPVLSPAASPTPAPSTDPTPGPTAPAIAAVAAVTPAPLPTLPPRIPLRLPPIPVRVLPTPTPAPRPSRSVQPGDWTEPRYDAGDTGYNSADTAMPASRIPSLRPVGSGYGAGQPAVAGGVAYYPKGGTIEAYVLDSCRGQYCQPSWRYDLGNPSNSQSAVSVGVAVAGGRLYATVNVYEAAWLWVFDASGCPSGLCPPLWRGQIDTWANSRGNTLDAPVVSGGVVYAAATGDNSLQAFAAGGCGAAVCVPLWTGAFTDASVTGSPAISGGLVYVDLFNQIAAYRVGGCGAASCAPAWDVNLPGHDLGGVAVTGGRIFATTYEGALLALDASSGTILWSTPTGETDNQLRSIPTVDASRLFVVLGTGLQAYDSTTGRLLWSGGVNDTLLGSASGADGVIYVSGSRQAVYAFATGGCGTAACSPLSTIATPESGDVPVIAEGYLLIGNTLYG